jgi:uncharacterized protein YjiS (DUF1127 family)
MLRSIKAWGRSATVTSRCTRVVWIFDMSAHIAKSQFPFELPSLSYIDTKWEEPVLREADATPKAVRNTGLAAWLSRRVGALVAWRHNSQAAAELGAMSDYELADIGLSRSDLSRVFKAGFNQELYQRGVGC